LSLVYIALGSNLGDRAANLAKAREMLGNDIRVLKCSSIYQTAPWGYSEQDDFYNQVLEGETELTPMRLLGRLKRVERGMGRKKTFRNGPRVIDLDILFYDGVILETRRLAIPHPGMHERAFVLVPLAEINPGLIHPVLGKTITELLAMVDQTGVNRIC
jgi:2-amino-4-hydroxy-6-hydroxymethyldihydropteridine diphosphokinase